MTWAVGMVPFHRGDNETSDMKSRRWRDGGILCEGQAAP